MAPKCFRGVFAMVLERVGSDMSWVGLDEFKVPSNPNPSLMKDLYFVTAVVPNCLILT